MKQKTATGLWLLGAFLLWTGAVCVVDVQAIGPLGTAVGLAAVNGFFHRLTGVHMALYTVTDWLGLVLLAVVAGFGCLGLVQWVKGKRLRKVDRSILVLGGFYLAVLAAYGIFETVLINYRPVLINGNLESSYPSSTTMLAMCVMPTAMMQLQGRIQNRTLRRWILLLMGAFTAFMVIGRLLSGVHWLTDVIGGALLSAGLVRFRQLDVHRHGRTPGVGSAELLHRHPHR